MEFRKARLQYVVLSLFVLWSVIAQVIISGYLIRSLQQSKNNGRLPFRLREDSLEVSAPSATMKSMGLRRGDEIFSINGEVITGFRQMERMRFKFKPGEKVQVQLRRQEDHSSKIVMMMVPVHEQTRRTLDWTITLVIHTFLPFFSLALGFFVAFSRPRDRLAWLTLAMLASFGQLTTGNFYALQSPWLQFVLIYRSILGNTWALWVMLFGFYFPKPFAFLRRRKWIPYLLALPFTILLIVDFYTDIYGADQLPRLRQIAVIERELDTPLLVFLLICVTSFLVSIAIKSRRSKDPDSRRRLRWLLYGSAVALIPASLVEVADGILGIYVPIWLFASALLAIVLFPLTLAYVIVVQRAMELRVAARIGVQYAFARGGIGVFRVLLASVVIIVCVKLALRSTGTVTAAIIIAFAVALLALLRKLGTRVIAWTDRQFFREAYDTEVILTELSQNVAGIRDTRTLLETVSRRISDSLHVPRVTVLLRSSDAFRPAYALGYEHPPSVELKPEAATIRVLRETKEPSKVYFDDEDSWVQRTPDEEREILRMLESQLLLPVSLKERLLGIISLGPKLSQEPYSITDLRLLNAVASQTGLALENARLTESIRREVAQRERINRELEIARDVQQRLFPQSVPAVPGLDLAGYCRPQQNVGGDYYDFVKLDKGCLGIAVGDVSGKGISAALMMATLQASLRGQTIKPGSRPAEIIQLINKLVYDASAANRYATFFYAQYDPENCSMVYVNAGHNPPIIWRPSANGREILRLEEGGTVLGLFPDFPYQECPVQLKKGDLLVAFTDGISEAMNRADEEWDEPRLIDAICESYGKTGSEVIGHILERVDAFTVGAEQHDDMTLVVARVQ
jgi:sigma-B regulation protein RsbU (phosphoserine phosphatase)